MGRIMVFLLGNLPLCLRETLGGPMRLDGVFTVFLEEFLLTVLWLNSRLFYIFIYSGLTLLFSWDLFQGAEVDTQN